MGTNEKLQQGRTLTQKAGNQKQLHNNSHPASEKTKDFGILLGLSRKRIAKQVTKLHIKVFNLIRLA